MPDSQKSLSRRKWFTAGAATSALLAARAQTQPAADRTLGVKTYNIRDFGAKGDGDDARHRGAASGDRRLQPRPGRHGARARRRLRHRHRRD